MFSNYIIWEYFIYTSTEQQSRKDVLVKTEGYTDIKVKIYIRGEMEQSQIE